MRAGKKLFRFRSVYPWVWRPSRLISAVLGMPATPVISLVLREAGAIVPKWMDVPHHVFAASLFTLFFRFTAWSFSGLRPVGHGRQKKEEKAKPYLHDLWPADCASMLAIVPPGFFCSNPGSLKTMSMFLKQRPWFLLDFPGCSKVPVNWPHSVSVSCGRQPALR